MYILLRFHPVICRNDHALRQDLPKHLNNRVQISARIIPDIDDRSVSSPVLSSFNAVSNCDAVTSSNSFT